MSLHTESRHFRRTSSKYQKDLQHEGWSKSGKYGLVGLILMIVSIVVGVIFSFNIFGGLTDTLIVFFGAIWPAALGFMSSSIGCCCAPNQGDPFCDNRCKQGRTLSFVTWFLNLFVATIFGVTLILGDNEFD